MHRGLMLVGVLGCCGMSQQAQAEEPPERFSVSLHARTTRASARAEQAAWLSLKVPLDGLVPRVRAAPVAVQSETTAEAEAPPTASEGSAGEQQPALSFATLAALSEFSRRAVAVALAVAGAPAERRRLDGLAARARWSSALPELRLRAQQTTDQALRWAPTSDDPYRVTQADGAGTTLEASATFRLDHLLFSSDELATERLRQQAGSEHLKLEQRVLGAVLGLFRARERACAPGVDEGARLEQLVRIAELAVELDVATAGWFSAGAVELSQAVWAFPEAILGACQPPAPPAPAPSTKAVASLAESE